MPLISTRDGLDVVVIWDIRFEASLSRIEYRFEVPSKRRECCDRKNSTSIEDYTPFFQETRLQCSRSLDFVRNNLSRVPTPSVSRCHHVDCMRHTDQSSCLPRN